MFFFIGNSINLNEIAAIDNVNIVAIITEKFSNPSLLISLIIIIPILSFLILYVILFKKLNFKFK